MVNTRAQDAVLVLSAWMIPQCGRFWVDVLGKLLGRPGSQRRIWLPFNVGGFCPWCTGCEFSWVGNHFNSNVRRMAQPCTGTRMERTTLTVTLLQRRCMSPGAHPQHCQILATAVAKRSVVGSRHLI